MTLRYGSLFSGYGGLDMGVQSVLGGSTAWFCEFDKAPSKILAHHWPDVPNLGDITAVDWAAVEPVDVLTGGFPCQDVSHAGRRAGLIRDGEGRTRSGLWGHMLRAVDQLRPRLVVAENVRGLLSAAADSDVEPCPWCLGDANGEPDMRALGAVLADLADVGYDAWWVGLRAADVGAAHGRFRVFIFAVPADPTGNPRWVRNGDGRAAADADGWGREDGAKLDRDATRPAAHGDSRGQHPDGHPGAAGLVLLPTPVADNSRGLPSSGTDYASLANVACSLLPTPRATDGTKGGPNQRGSSGDLMLPSAVNLLPTPRVTQAGYADDGRGGKSLPVEAKLLLPTPSVADVEGGRKHRSGDRSDELLLNGIAHHQAWGDYAPAIARWESATGRTAPAPTERGPVRHSCGGDESCVCMGNPRLSPLFVEWLMGLPAGHVTDVGLTRNEQLKALGNGVVPQQAAAATRWWLTQIGAAA